MPAEARKPLPEVETLRSHLKDRHWRLANLYQIKDENAQIVRFRPNAAQRAYEANAWYRDLIPKARRLGFSTYIGVSMLDRMLFVPNTACGIIDLTLDDAKSKLDIVKLAYAGIPEGLRATLPLARPTNQSEITFGNGSSITVGTTHRGGGLNWLHLSEFGKISVNAPDLAREIKTGAFPAAIAGRITNESTAHGTSGEFADQVKGAIKMRESGAQLSRLDWRLHFFGWWMKPEYRLGVNLATVTVELREYFERLRERHGIVLDAEQQAWYAKQIAEYGSDDMMEEYPSSVDELFFNSGAGAYFKEAMSKARREGRIGQPVPHDTSRKVNTAWDIGEDCMAIVCFQDDGLRVRVVGYFEEIGGSLQSGARWLDEQRVKRGFVYGTHFGPHDLENRDWANNANTRKQTALDLGIKFEVVPRVQYKEDSINALRRLIDSMWVDEDHAKLFADRLDNYRKKWNNMMQQFVSEPLHDINSHGADAGQQMAMGRRPDRDSRPRSGRSQVPRSVSHWGRG